MKILVKLLCTTYVVIALFVLMILGGIVLRTFLLNSVYYALLGLSILVLVLGALHAIWIKSDTQEIKDDFSKYMSIVSKSALNGAWFFFKKFIYFAIILLIIFIILDSLPDS